MGVAGQVQRRVWSPMVVLMSPAASVDLGAVGQGDRKHDDAPRLDGSDCGIEEAAFAP